MVQIIGVEVDGEVDHSGIIGGTLSNTKGSWLSTDFHQSVTIIQNWRKTEKNSKCWYPWLFVM